jgi:preprotein translocase subunit SecE
LVEHRTPNPGVGGSNPSWPATFSGGIDDGCVSRWLKEAPVIHRRAKRGEMGRLLRKKDPSKKIKKQQSVDQVDGERNSTASQNASQPVAKKTYTPASKPTVVKEKNFIDKSIQFLREVKVELKKVTWPSRKQTMGSTVVVVVIVAIISIFLGIVDAGLSGLIRAVLQ